jgi:predicted metal-dependent hydrolase
MITSSPATTRTLTFGRTRLEYTLRRHERSDLAITVHPDLRIEVLAPAHRSDSEIESKVRARGTWIMRQRLRFEALHPLPIARRYVSGESFRYLGRQYRLRVVPGDESHVVLRRPHLIVQTPVIAARPVVEGLVKDWYRTRALAMLPRYFTRVVESHPSLGDKQMDVRVRAMRRRWGSCTPSGTITLNPELIQASAACIEYVIVHELCHRRLLHHGPEFFRLLSTVLPDWRSRREALNRVH